MSRCSTGTAIGKQKCDINCRDSIARRLLLLGQPFVFCSESSERWKWRCPQLRAALRSQARHRRTNISTNTSNNSEPSCRAKQRECVSFRPGPVQTGHDRQTRRQKVMRTHRGLQDAIISQSTISMAYSCLRILLMHDMGQPLDMHCYA